MPVLLIANKDLRKLQTAINQALESAPEGTRRVLVGPAAAGSNGEYVATVAEERVAKELGPDVLTYEKVMGAMFAPEPEPSPADGESAPAPSSVRANPRPVLQGSPPAPNPTRPHVATKSKTKRGKSSAEGEG